MQLHRSESTILVVALALVFQPSSANSNGGRNGLQQVFTNGPGRGYVAVQRLSRTRNSQQPAAKQCGRTVYIIVKIVLMMYMYMTVL